MGKLLRVDLTTKDIAEEALNEATLRQYIGNTGNGIKYLYHEILPRTQVGSSRQPPYFSIRTSRRDTNRWFRVPSQ